MAFLQVNLSEIPESVPLVEPGEYNCTIEKVDFKAAEGNRSDRFSFDFKILEGPETGKHLFEDFTVEYLADPRSAASVKFGHLARSAGIPLTSGGIDTDELKGKSVRILVNHRNYTDKSTNEAKTAVNIKDYLYVKTA